MPASRTLDDKSSTKPLHAGLLAGGYPAIATGLMRLRPGHSDGQVHRGGAEEGAMTEKASRDVSIGKFDILATYTYAHALISGLEDDEAKQRGMVAAIMGARARRGVRSEHHEEFQAQKEAAERKKKTTITAESFDKQVADKMGGFFDEVFLPTMKKLVEAGLSYDDVKRLVKIPTTWGAEITRPQVRQRASAYLSD